MTSLQIQSFASLIDQLPSGVEESERIDQAANAACSSGSEDGSAERTNEFAESKGNGSRRDSSKNALHDCRQPAGLVTCTAEEPLSGGHVYGGSAGFHGMSFPSLNKDTTFHQLEEQPNRTLLAGGCAVQSNIGDGTFIPPGTSVPRDTNARQQLGTGLRGFFSQGESLMTESTQGFVAVCSEEAPSTFPGTAAPHDYSNAELTNAPPPSGSRSVSLGNQGPMWPPSAQGYPSSAECKYGHPCNRPGGNRVARQPQQSFRTPVVAHGDHGMYGGNQLQVSILSPGEDVVVTRYGCPDWSGCCNGCQVQVTRVSRPASPRQQSTAHCRPACSPANTKVKSVSPSGPDHFVLCLEGESGQEQHVSIDRQELMLVASFQGQASTEQDTAKSAAGTRQENGTIGKTGPVWANDDWGGVHSSGLPAEAFSGPADGRCEKWNQEVRTWQNEFCRELEAQKIRLLQREEACRKREEEFRQREDESRRQKMTIAALEGEVQKVTEEMQEILLQKEEGRLIVQREFLERKGRYVSRLQGLRPFLGIHFEDVLRGLTSCRTIGQLSTWSSVFDATEAMTPRTAAQHILEVLKSGITAPLFVSQPTSATTTSLVGVAVDIVSRPASGNSAMRYTAMGPLTDQCIYRIPSLTNDSHVRADDGSEITADSTQVGPGHFSSRLSNADDQRLSHPTHTGEAALSRCRHHLNGQGHSEEQHGRDNARGLRAGAWWGGGIDSLNLPLNSPTLEAAGVKDILTAGPQYSVQTGHGAIPLSGELTLDGIYLRPVGSRLPSRTTSICWDQDSTHADWAPCRIDSRHAGEAFDSQQGDVCGSWMERVAYASAGGSLAISFFNAGTRPRRAPSPVCG